MNRNTKRLFLKKEGNTILGYKKLNFVLLVIIFLIAILAIGFGSAGLDYLKTKMDDPFILWVDIKTRQNISTDGKLQINDFLDDKEVQTKHQFIDPQPNYISNIYFRTSNGKKDILLEGRSIKEGSAILEKILEKDNTIEYRSLPFGDSDLGIIVTAETLLRLGYSENDWPSFLYFSRSFDSKTCIEQGLGEGLNGWYEVAFPIIAIVHQLPGMKSFMFSERFLHDTYSKSGTPWDITLEENNQYLYICGNNEDLTKIESQLGNKNLHFKTCSYNESWKPQHCLEIETEENNPTETYNNLFNSLKQEGLDITRIYKFAPTVNYDEDIIPEYYSIQMLSLDSIRLFHDDLINKTGLKLEMTTIDAKDNFNFVQKMGNRLSNIIIIISIIFICVFIYFLLNSHFQRIEKNIGTFKAFGISNKALRGIYLTLMESTITVSFFTAFLLSWFFSSVYDCFNKIENIYSYFNIFTYRNWQLLLFSLVSVLVVTLIVSGLKLKHSPGDLIYGRANIQKRKRNNN